MCSCNFCKLLLLRVFPARRQSCSGRVFGNAFFLKRCWTNCDRRPQIDLTERPLALAELSLWVEMWIWITYCRIHPLGSIRSTSMAVQSADCVQLYFCLWEFCEFPLPRVCPARRRSCRGRVCGHAFSWNDVWQIVIEGHRLAERPLVIIEWSLFGEVNTSFYVYYDCVACGREVQIVCSCIFVCRKLFHPGVCPARRQNCCRGGVHANAYLWIDVWQVVTEGHRLTERVLPITEWKLVSGEITIWASSSLGLSIMKVYGLDWGWRRMKIML